MREGNTDIYNFDQVRKFISKVDLNNVDPGIITYPPTLYVMMIPLTYIPWQLSADIWLIFNYLCLLWSGYILARLLVGKHKSFWWVLPVTVTALYTFTPTQDNLVVGQVNVPLLMLLLMTLHLLSRERDYLTGIMLGVIFWVKLISAPIIGWYLMRDGGRLSQGLRDQFLRFLPLPPLGSDLCLSRIT